MAARINYQIVGRYMNGKEVTGYHLQSMDSGKSGRYTREQVAFLVGRGQVTNCEGQIYQDKLLLRGVGISLDSLPVKQENGGLSRTDGIGRVKNGTTAADAMTQFMITSAIVSGRNVIGYVIRNAGGQTKNINRETTLKLAKEGRIGNARVQESNGKYILRGVNTNLNELPTIKAESLVNGGTAENSNKPDNRLNIIKQYAKEIVDRATNVRNNYGVKLTKGDRKDSIKIVISYNYEPYGTNNEDIVVLLWEDNGEYISVYKRDIDTNLMYPEVDSEKLNSLQDVIDAMKSTKSFDRHRIDERENPSKTLLLTTFDFKAFITSLAQSKGLNISNISHNVKETISIIDLPTHRLRASAKGIIGYPMGCEVTMDIIPTQPIRPNKLRPITATVRYIHEALDLLNKDSEFRDIPISKNPYDTLSRSNESEETVTVDRDRRKAYLEARHSNREIDLLNSTAKFKEMIKEAYRGKYINIYDKTDESSKVIKFIGKRFSKVLTARISEYDCVLSKNATGRKFSAFLPFIYFRYSGVDGYNPILRGVMRIDSDSFEPSYVTEIDIYIGDTKIINNGRFCSFYESDTIDTSLIDDIMRVVKLSIDNM